MKVYSFLQLECKWNICPRFVIIFWPQMQKYILCYITRWTVHIQYDNLCNVIYHYISSLFTTVIWKSYISFYVICLPSYRPYNLLEKKTLELLCMLCNLCFVSVKKVEKWVSWLLVSVEMAPSEIVLEDNSLVWHSKKIWFPGHDNLRSRATPTNPSPLHPLPYSTPQPPPPPPPPTYRYKHAGKHTHTHTDT